MHTVDTRTMGLMEGWLDEDESAHVRANLAPHRNTGAEDSSAEVIELDPGQVLGEPTASPEKIVLVMQGAVELTIGDTYQLALPGTVTVVPAMVPHSMRNIGDTTARVIGFFPSPRVVSEYVAPIRPVNVQSMDFGDDASATAAN